jgi:8-oxo-dGTP pyrophosphatase MutT (NUDIX family)
MKQTNICFLMKDGQVLLGMKKRGFGSGKWNGFGGKLKEGEDPRDAMVREIKEEIGISVLPDRLREMGTLEFKFQNNPD